MGPTLYDNAGSRNDEAPYISVVKLLTGKHQRMNAVGPDGDGCVAQL